MRRSYIVIGAIVVVVLLIGAPFWGTYNSLVAQSQGVDEQWAQVQTQYQRRYDLIPNLVNSVKGGMAQEQAIFNAIAEARTRYAGAPSADERARAAGELEGALSRLLVIMENYPQVRSLEAVKQLMDELAGTENRISVERRRYNERVRDYNIEVKSFPRNLVAGLFGFRERSFFEAAAGTEEPPKVQF